MVTINARLAYPYVKLAFFRRVRTGLWMPTRRFHHMASSLQKSGEGLSLRELFKSSVFTSKLPADPAFETPEISHRAPREALGPRLVRGALYTFVRPEPAEEYEILGVSPKALDDLGLAASEATTQEFHALVSGNEFPWDQSKGGIYPWAQCYGGKSCHTHTVFTYSNHGRQLNNILKGGNCTLQDSWIGSPMHPTDKW